MSGTNLDIARPDLPTDSAPPDIDESGSQLERHDWVFVGYPGWTSHTPPRFNVPAIAHYFTDAAEVDRAVITVLERDRDRVRYPYLLLAPAIVAAFEAAFVEAEVAATRGANPAGMVRVWDVVVDLTVPPLICGLHPHPLGCPTSCDQGEYNPASMPDATDDQRDLVHDEWFLDDWRDVLGKRRGTAGELFTAMCQHEIHARLHAADDFEGSGWFIFLRGRDESLRTLTGRPLYQKEDVDKLRAELAAPASLEQVSVVLETVKQMWRAANQDDESWERSDDWPPAFVVHGVMQRKAAAQNVGAAARAVAEEASSPAPDPKLADQIETFIGKFFAERGRGPGRFEIVKRVTARKQHLDANLKWLCRAGGPITKRRRGKADEYVPSDEG